MCAPINGVSLDDLSFYLDKRLASRSVYNVVVFCVDIEIVCPDIMQLMHKYSSVQMLQEIGDSYAKFTFVSAITFVNFSTCFDKVLDFCRAKHKLNSSTLFYC